MLQAVGLPEGGVAGDGPWRCSSVVIMDIWHSTPFFMLVLLAGLQSIDTAQLDAAQVDGASRWQVFRFVHPAAAPAAIHADRRLVPGHWQP